MDLLVPWTDLDSNAVRGTDTLLGLMFLVPFIISVARGKNILASIAGCEPQVLEFCARR
jgi:hypothetical protein